MKLPRLKKISTDQFGDTIIEVILAIAALGTAVAVAYVSTGHSLQVGIDAGNRGRVVGLTQKQIERLKLALKASNDNVSPYAAIGGPFCLTAGGVPTTDPIRTSGPNQNYCEVCVNPSGATQAGTLEFVDNSTGLCPQASDRPLYALQVTYKELVFTINSKWVGPGGSVSEQTQYYKVPGINGAPLGNPTDNSGPAPSSCIFDSTNSGVQVDTASGRYLAYINLEPNCNNGTRTLIQRSTFPGYPIVYFNDSSSGGYCYYADGSNPYQPPNTSYPTSPASLNADQVATPGRVYNKYTFYVRNPGDYCTIRFTWKGWDTRWSDPQYIRVTCEIPAATCWSTGLTSW